MAATGSFWARRKAGVQAEAAAEAAAARAASEAAEAEVLVAEQADKTEAEILEHLGLPNPDSMAQGDDFSAFMGRAVPEHLRRRALRKLWVSNPVLANLDGLVDHGEDYTDAATVIPGMKSAYQVGKGMMQHVIALAEKAAAKEQAAAIGAAQLAVAEPDTDVDVVEEPVSKETARMEQQAKAPSRVTDEVDEVAPRPRRHMRFEFSS